MPLFEMGRLGAMTETYNHTDKGTGIDVWRVEHALHMRWGRRGFIVEFGRGRRRLPRPWRISWGWNDQITFYEPKSSRHTLDDDLDGLEEAGLISIGGEAATD